MPSLYPCARTWINQALGSRIYDDSLNLILKENHRKKSINFKKCEGRDLNPRTPSGTDLESVSVDQA
jgi:hypothetical protein